MMKKNLTRYFKELLANLIGLMPILMVLDFGMNIQLLRDFGWHITLFFMVSLGFYAVIFSRYLYKVN